MRPGLLSLSLMSAICVWAAPLPAAVTNGGFEQGSGATAEGWSFVAQGGNTAGRRVEGGAAGKAIAIYVDEKGGAGLWRTEAFMTLEPKALYRITFRYRCENGAVGPSLVLPGVKAWPFAPSKEWQTAEAQVVNEKDRKVMVRLCLRVEAKAGKADTVLFDDVTFEPVGTWVDRDWEVLDAISETPPEMVGRKETRKPVVTFESLAGWRLIGHYGGVGLARKSVEEQLFDRPSLKVELYSAVKELGWVEMNPPAPIPLGREADSVFVWLHSVRRLPTQIIVKLLDDQGKLVKVDLGWPKWTYWFLKQACIGKTLGPGAAFAGFEFRNLPHSSAGIHTIYAALVDAGCPLKEPLPKTYERLPANLPFPTTPDTLLPTFKVTGSGRVSKRGEAYHFEYEGPDARFAYRYTPRTGTLDDLEIVSASGAFKPASGSGLAFEFGGKRLTGPPVVATGLRVNSYSGREGAKTVLSDDLKPSLLEEKFEGATLRVTWRFEAEGDKADVAYAFALRGKSLVVEMSSADRNVTNAQYGVAENAPDAKRVTFPSHCALAGPGVLCTRDLFVTLAADWYVSNASFWPGRVWNGPADGARLGYTYTRTDGVLQFGYSPKTNGERNPLFERVFITASPDFQEVIWNIPNPASPMGRFTKKNLYLMMVSGKTGEGARRQDYTRWFPERARLLKRYGVDHVICMHHAPMYSRAGGKRDPFYMTTRVSGLQEGGLGAIQRYMTALKDMGWVPGIYTTYALIHPLARHWDPNAVAYSPTGEWNDHPKGYQSYRPKATAALALVNEWAPRMRDTFHAAAAYQDVTTANRPAAFVDYDHRVQDSAMARAAFAGFGLALMREREIMNGPVFSEGGGHMYYAGLVDGNYPNPIRGSDKEPWLLNLELLKMHPLMADVMMHYVHYTKNLDRYICASVAHGHMGYAGAGALTGGYMDFEGNSDIPAALRIYYMMQQLQEQYILEKVKTIRYFNGAELLDTSAAVRSGAYERNQVFVEYNTGLRVWANGNFTESWTVVDGGKKSVLPPTGWMAKQGKRLAVFSGELGGRRVDAAYTPAYVYVDGRGAKTVFDGVTTNAQVIIRKADATSLEVIPVQIEAPPAIALSIVPKALGLKSSSVKVEALDKDGRVVGEAEVFRADRAIELTVSAGVFSFRVSGSAD
ncbi:MAG TPA: hypothetical protein P5137_04600 [Candidatus Brocadiia bacterium]|nr:hypothetical protein [Candidatus Brocadiia bacterium]